MYVNMYIYINGTFAGTSRILQWRPVDFPLTQILIDGLYRAKTIHLWMVNQGERETRRKPLKWGVTQLRYESSPRGYSFNIKAEWCFGVCLNMGGSTLIGSQSKTDFLTRQSTMGDPQIQAHQR